MNEKFFINGRCYKTPCRTVLKADEFTVKIFTCNHTITANVSDKCYFVSIDNIPLSDIKCDFFFSRNYTNPKEFLSKLNETFISFLNTSISDKKFPLCKNTDEVLDRIIEIVTATDHETAEIEGTTETKSETATEAEAETETEEAKLAIIFDDENSKHKIRTKFYLLESFNRLNINHYYVEIMTDKRVGAFYLYLKFDENGNVEKALCKFFHIISEFRNNVFDTLFLYALAEKYNGVYCTPDFGDFAYYKKISDECKTPETFEPFISSGEKCFFISPDKNNKKSALNSLYGIRSNTSPEINNECDETEELLAVEHFERLTGTLYKSLFKAIGLEETKKIPFIISNNMVFFNYNGVQYKYYPSQCKIFKKCVRKYQRINWKDFADDNSPTDQKQALGRSPPLLLI